LSKLRVLIAVEYYLPGFKAGGPIRSVSALVDQLGHEIDFSVITRDRDAGSDSRYAVAQAGRWVSMHGAQVRYLAPTEMSAGHLLTAIRERHTELIYLNSFFAPMSVRILLARRLGALRGIPILLAPRGELSPGALRLKAFKKRWFLRGCRWLRLHRGVVFHASTERESGEITQALSLKEAPRVARNPVGRAGPCPESCPKAVGAVRFVFLSRISPKKNLLFAIDLLTGLQGHIEFDIYGPVLDHADQAYWRACMSRISALPANVSVTYRGAVPSGLVTTTLAAHHFFLFPTASENFGHAIVEALLAGCPIVTSDQTPWLELEKKGIGWDLPLEDTGKWQQVLRRCVAMDGETYRRASDRARAFGRQIASTDTAAENLKLLRAVGDRVGHGAERHEVSAI
jgi:glycosyltransferase involved in cell wall biosynthesis